MFFSLLLTWLIFDILYPFGISSTEGYNLGTAKHHLDILLCLESKRWGQQKFEAKKITFFRRRRYRIWSTWHSSYWGNLAALNIVVSHGRVEDLVKNKSNVIIKCFFCRQVVWDDIPVPYIYIYFDWLSIYTCSLCSELVFQEKVSIHVHCLICEAHPEVLDGQFF